MSEVLSLGGRGVVVDVRKAHYDFAPNEINRAGIRVPTSTFDRRKELRQGPYSSSREWLVFFSVHAAMCDILPCRNILLFFHPWMMGFLALHVS